MSEEMRRDEDIYLMGEDVGIYGGDFGTSVADLLGRGESGEAYRLTHDGKAVTFTLGEKMTDVSAILTKP